VINYNDPNRWLILQYRPGTGGKFLSACLMTLDCVAHWDSRVENQTMSFRDWVDTQWNPTDQTNWIAFEPLHNWDLTFFSRTFPRGSDLSLTEFNQQTSIHSSEYFKKVWQGDKLILDFLNKSEYPLWWQSAKSIKLDAIDGCTTHRKFLLEKIYPWDPVTGMGLVMMDKPLSENKYQNARVFNNVFEYGPFESEDMWYKFIWEHDFRLSFPITSPDLLVTDLLNWNKLKEFISGLADDLNTIVDEENLRYLFDYWNRKNLLTRPK
jgi:hypothetical protein